MCASGAERRTGGGAERRTGGDGRAPSERPARPAQERPAQPVAARDVGRSQPAIASWRSDYGDSTRLWSGLEATSGADLTRLERSRHLVEDDRWLAFSGAVAVDFNLALCHGPDRSTVEEALHAAKALRRPAILMLAGPALGSAGVLADGGFACIGSQPFMQRSLGGAAHARHGGATGGDGVRRLAVEDLPAYRQLAEEVFGMDADLARVALPDSLGTGGAGGGAAAADRAPAGAAAGTGLAAWGLFAGDELRSAIAAVTSRTSTVLWSMATARAEQGRGHGRRLLEAVLARAALDGSRNALLASSPAGERLYRGAGFAVVEHWQLWTSPRWVLA